MGSKGALSPVPTPHTSLAHADSLSPVPSDPLEGGWGAHSPLRWEPLSQPPRPTPLRASHSLALRVPFSLSRAFPAVTFLHLLAKPPRLLTAQAGPRTDLWLGASSLTLPVHSRVQPGTEGVPFCEASPSDSPGVRPPGGWEPIRISSAVLGLCKLPVVLMKLNYN